MDSEGRKDVTRRCFLKTAIVGVGAITAGGSVALFKIRPSRAATLKSIPKATMVVFHDPALCAGCRRCEAACSTVREGASQPSRSRIFIDRQYQEALWADGQFIGETCRQCEDPSCLQACPVDAIKIDEKTKARYVDLDICEGLGNCERACPFDMVNYFEDERKVRICDTCGGDPACVKQCPTGALQFVKWDPRYDDLSFELKS